MASRRMVSSSKSALEKDDGDFKQAPGDTSKSNITPAVPAHVIYKLLGFTLAMVVGPIGSYFLSLDMIFGGNSTYAGATAAIVANVVLVAYVVVAFQEDHREISDKSRKGK